MSSCVRFSLLKPASKNAKKMLQRLAGERCYEGPGMEVPARVEDFIPRLVLDKVFLGYYVFQIVTTLCLDMQGTLPAFLYPSWIRAIYKHHCEMWRDPWLANTWQHPWYFSICLWEYIFHVPYYFLAAYAYYQRVKGTDKCTWIRIPAIMYCTQTMTAVSSVILMALLEDFNPSATPVPNGLFQRLKLAGMYSFFFFACLLNLLDVLTGRDYQPAMETKKKKQARGGSKSRQNR